MSSLRNIVPSNWTQESDSTITFTPTPAFWNAWRTDRNWLQDLGIQPYPIQHKPRKVWLVEVNLDSLDTLHNCATCGTLTSTRGKQCLPCWQKRNA